MIIPQQLGTVNVHKFAAGFWNGFALTKILAAPERAAEHRLGQRDRIRLLSPKKGF
jgi:hypothetical protein